MVRYTRPCMVRGCMPPDSKRFSFPRTVQWAEKWKELCVNPKLKDIPAEKLHTRFAICRKHFAKHQFVNHLMEKLNQKIVPTLFLPPLESLNNISSSTSDVSGDDKDALHTILEQNVVLPPVDVDNTQGSGVANDAETCSDDSNGGNGSFSEAKPSISSDLLSCPQVVQDNEENEKSVLESTSSEEVIGPINNYYRYTLCRLCFCFCDSLTNIFEEENECGFVISDAVEDLLRFKVSKTDDFPQFICSSCLVRLGEFKEFKDELCKKKEKFEKVLEMMRKSSVDEDEVVTVIDKEDPPMDEDLENSNEADSVNHLSEGEEIDEEDINKEDYVTDHSEFQDSSESEDSVTDFEDTAVEEVAEPEAKNSSGQGMKEIVLQEDYKCFDCGEVFKFVNLLTKHIKEHRKTWPLPCQYCDKRFRSLIDLNNHIIMHSDYKPFECEHCGLRCRTKTTLTRHKMTHSDNKPFLCSLCGMSFRDRIQLRDHLRMHSNIKCYKCEECGKEFRTSSKLKNHLVCHMKESPFVCRECGKSFKKATSLNWHIMCIHSSQKLFQCHLCEKSFSIRKYLNSHLKIHRRQAI